MILISFSFGKFNLDFRFPTIPFLFCYNLSCLLEFTWLSYNNLIPMIVKLKPKKPLFICHLGREVWSPIFLLDFGADCSKRLPNLIFVGYNLVLHTLRHWIYHLVQNSQQNILHYSFYKQYIKMLITSSWVKLNFINYAVNWTVADFNCSDHDTIFFFSV